MSISIFDTNAYVPYRQLSMSFRQYMNKLFKDLKYCFVCGCIMPKINEVLEQFLEMNLVEVRRKIEKLEKDRAFYLQRAARIEDNLELVRLCRKE